jgi:hypothetical protein
MFEIMEHKIKDRSKMIFDARLATSHAKYKDSLDTILGTLFEIEFLILSEWKASKEPNSPDLLKEYQ